jgi:hypothetical protein
MTDDRPNTAQATSHGGAAGASRVLARLGALGLAWVLVAGVTWAVVASAGGSARTGGVVTHAAVVKPPADSPAFVSQLPALRTRRNVHAKRHPAAHRSHRAAGSSALTASSNGAASAAATQTSAVSSPSESTASVAPVSDSGSGSGSGASGSANVPPTGGPPSP